MRLYVAGVAGMQKALICIATAIALILCGCAQTQGGNQNGSAGAEASTTVERREIAHRYASASEAKDLLLSNDKYYAGFSQNDLDFRMQKSGATMEEYKSFAAEQTRDFTDEEKDTLDKHLADMATMLAERGYTLPPLEEVTFVKTTMAEECNAGGYTHDTTIFLASAVLDGSANKGEFEGNSEFLEVLLWHELFHCLTRNNPDFRADMYKLIHFTVHDAEYALPPSVMEYHISNPDVERHDSSAMFKIDGKDVECFMDWVTTKHFQKKGENFFGCAATALVPVDGTDTFYTSDQAANFNEVFGGNTGYVIDPEECMADNFSFAMTFGREGPAEGGYKSPEIIEGIIAYLSR